MEYVTELANNCLFLHTIIVVLCLLRIYLFASFTHTHTHTHTPAHIFTDAHTHTLKHTAVWVHKPITRASLKQGVVVMLAALPADRLLERRRQDGAHPGLSPPAKRHLRHGEQDRRGDHHHGERSACVHAQTLTHARTRAHTHTFTHTHTRTHAHTDTDAHTCTHMPLSVYTQ